MDTQPAPTAPPVVAVVVTADAGPWLEECLTSLAAQDYPNLSVLVIDDASDEDPTARVASVFPTAYVRRLTARVGFPAAVNEILAIVEGASHYLICHDDVAPDRDAVRLLVEEAFRSNAGVVTPKYVSWDDPRRLVAVGCSIDKSGVPAPLVDPGELDQEQHDAVRDVFFAPAGCTLIRADLFATLGGFDPAMIQTGEDVDLCWRAHIAGARVIVAPAGRVRHLQARPGDAVEHRRRRDDLRPIVLRNRLRAVLKNYSRWHLVRVLPQIGLLAVVEALYGFVAGQATTSKAIIGAYRDNFRDRREIRAERARVRSYRAVADSEIRRWQVHGSARFRSFYRGQLHGEDRARQFANAAGDLAGSVAGGDLRTPFMVSVATLAVLALGTRGLLFGPLPSIGDLAPLPDSPFTLLRHFVSGWRTSGLGSEAPAPPLFALLGLAGLPLFGAMSLVHKVAVLGMLPLGVAGAWRLSAPFGSRRGRLVASVVYAANPVAYNALAEGRWGAMVSYGVSPWVLLWLARAMGITPYGDNEPSWRRAALPLAVVTALAASVTPMLAALPLVIAVSVLAGSLVAGGGRAALVAVGAAGAAGLGAAALLFPWTLSFLPPGGEWSIAGGLDVSASSAASFGDLLRFATGPIGRTPAGWALLVAAALPIVIGSQWRFEWAVRCWAVAAGSIALAWVAGRGWLPGETALPAPEVLLAPAALAFALSAALGLVAFEVDLPGYRFGWRQVASVLAAGSVVIAVIPVLAVAGDGRWRAPDRDLGGLLSFLDDPVETGTGIDAEATAPVPVVGDFRVVWIGAPAVLPVRGWRLQDGVGWAMSRNGFPDATDGWPAPSRGATRLVSAAVELAERNETTRLGHLLAPMAVRYIVVVQPPRSPLPEALLEGLRSQVDLREVPSDPSVVLYENSAWAPRGAIVPDAVAETVSSPAPLEARRAELAGSSALDADGSFAASGDFVAGDTVLWSEAYSPRWSLSGGAEHGRAFGWANRFTAADDGSARVTYSTSPMRYAALAIQLALWALVIRALAGRWLQARRTRSTRAVSAVEPSPSVEGRPTEVHA